MLRKEISRSGTPKRGHSWRHLWTEAVAMAKATRQWMSALAVVWNHLGGSFRNTDAHILSRSRGEAQASGFLEVFWVILKYNLPGLRTLMGRSGGEERNFESPWALCVAHKVYWVASTPFAVSYPLPVFSFPNFSS